MHDTRRYLAIGMAVLMLASAAGAGMAATPTEQGDSYENETDAGGPPADVGNGSAGPPDHAGDENETEENETEDDERENETAANATGERGPPAHAGPNGTLPPVANAPPHDLDGDGEYEDVNGNNETDLADVVVYFAHVDEEPIENNTEAYDYTNNGDTDVADAVELFKEV